MIRTGTSSVCLRRQAPAREHRRDRRRPVGHRQPKACPRGRTARRGEDLRETPKPANSRPGDSPGPLHRGRRHALTGHQQFLDRGPSRRDTTNAATSSSAPSPSPCSSSGYVRDRLTDRPIPSDSGVQMHVVSAVVMHGRTAHRRWKPISSSAQVESAANAEVATPQPRGQSREPSN